MATIECAKLLPLEAVAGLVPRAATVMVGGFGVVGSPVAVVESLLHDPQVTDLTVISNNLGEPGKGLSELVRARRIRRAIGSYFTTNREVVDAYLRREIEIELTPQGTLAEAIRAGGAGIAAFFVRTGAGTAITGARETRRFGGELHVLWEALRADVALIRARRADALGNLVYDKSARNFNPEMATAADVVIAQVDELVPVGALDPEAIVTPHLLVDHLVLSPSA